MGHWTLDDIPWQRFDPAKVNPDLLCVVKAASLVEYDGGGYAEYLCRVFHDDAEFQAVARGWGLEEIQHGAALGRWARLADPSFELGAAFARFKTGFDSQLGGALSKRGSRSGEMVARCMVEVGTSSYYSALAEAAEEPVLEAICKKIAADELRHYKLFYTCLQRYQAREGLGRWGKIRVALTRVAESEDDELAYAYYAANGAAAPYDRRTWNRAYARRAYPLYRPHHVERAVPMIFKAIGLVPNGPLGRWVGRAAWQLVRFRASRLVKSPA